MATKKRGKRAALVKHATAPAAAATGGIYRSRIVGQDMRDPSTLREHPRNWRVHTKHQRSVTDDTMRTIGWIQQIVLNVRTGFMIDGHLRRDLAIEAREPLVPVLLVDLSPEDELLALATLDPLSELAATDPDALAKLLSKVQRPGDGGALSGMLADLEQQAAATMLRAVEEPSGSRTQTTPRAGQTIRIALAVPDVNTIERAILKTGQINRGEAFLLICNHYLNSVEPTHDTNARAEDGQHDNGAEGELARGFAKTLGAAEPGDS